MENNYLSVYWFAKNVFPIIEEKDSQFKLYIIGKVSDENKKKLQSISDNVVVLGYVEQLDEEIRNAALIAAPVLYGAGVKVKVIDALSYGQVVIATEKAIEGTGLLHGEHLLVGEEPSELADYCVDVIHNRHKYEKMMNSGLRYVKQIHSIEHQSTILKKVLE